MEQQDSFQAAIDYLIANKKKPVFNNQGLFTQPAPETKPSVVTGLFGDEYIRKPQDRDSGGFEQPFTGSPFSSPRNGLSSLTDAARYRDTASGIRNNKDAVSAGFGLLSKVNPVFGLLGVGVRYGAPKLLDYFGDRAYNQYGQEMQQIGGELFNPADPNFAALAYNEPNYDAFRSDANVVVGGPIDTSLIQGTSIYGGEPGVGIDSGNFDTRGGFTDAGGGDYGRSGAANDRD